MPSNKLNTVAVIARDNQMITGIQKDLSTQASIVLVGKSYTPMGLVQLIQSRTKAIQTAAAAHAQWLETVKDLRAVSAEVDAAEAAMKPYLINLFGPEAPELADFNVKPRKKPTPLTADERAAAVAKAKATKLRKKVAVEAAARAPGAPAPVATTPATPATTVNLVVTAAPAEPIGTTPAKT